LGDAEVPNVADLNRRNGGRLQRTVRYLAISEVGECSKWY
jgi:hypothetical protein